MKFLPENIDSQDLINCLRNINLEILDLLKYYYQRASSDDDFQKKLNIKNSSSGPVTSADIKLNQLIIKNLKQNYPLQKWGIVSEESNKNQVNLEFQNDWIWIIDPLDGTKDFINNTGEYAVHIALTFKKSVVLSNVLIPQKHESWFYVKGIGTWAESKIEKNIPLKKINSKQLKEMVVVTSRNHIPKELSVILNKLNPLRIVGMGSIGYKAISIIKGEADLYISYAEKGKSCPKDWDMAAPSSIIRGAGGHFTDVHGSNIEFLKNDNYEQGGIILSSMNKNHQGLCKEILENLKNI